MRYGWLLLASGLAFAAASAAAQPAPAPAQPEPASPSVPIGDLLAKQAAALPDPEETGRAPEPAPSQERAPPPVASPGLSGEAYDRRIRASIAAAQGYQGPLDGGWTLSAPDGELYALQLVDRGRGQAIEGAWRDLRKPSAPDASGFIDQVERTGGEVTVRFGTRVAVLRGGADGRFAGELTEGEAHRPVTMVRRP